MTSFRSRTILFVLLLAGAVQPTQAQLSVDVTDDSGNDMVIAVPAMPKPQPARTAAGPTEALGRQVAEIVAADLRGSGLFRPLGPGSVRPIGFSEVTEPAYDYWPGTGAAALVQGYVQA